MTYCICDQDGWVGDLATITGLNDMWGALKGKGKAIDELIATGMTEDIVGVIENLHGVSHPDANIETTIRNFRSLAHRAVGIMIVTDGAGEDDGKPDTTDEEIQAHLDRIPASKQVKKNTIDPVKESLKRIPAWQGKL